MHITLGIVIRHQTSDQISDIWYVTSDIWHQKSTPEIRRRHIRHQTSVKKNVLRNGNRSIMWTWKALCLVSLILVDPGHVAKSSYRAIGAYYEEWQIAWPRVDVIRISIQRCQSHCHHHPQYAPNNANSWIRIDRPPIDDGRFLCFTAFCVNAVGRNCWMTVALPAK